MANSGYLLDQPFVLKEMEHLDIFESNIPVFSFIILNNQSVVSIQVFFCFFLVCNCDSHLQVLSIHVRRAGAFCFLSSMHFEHLFYKQKRKKLFFNGSKQTDFFFMQAFALTVLLPSLLLKRHYYGSTTLLSAFNYGSHFM